MDEVTFLKRLRDVLIASGQASSVETHEDDPELAHNEIRVDGYLQLVAEPAPGRQPPEPRSAPKIGINPVTFSPRSSDQPFLVISRLHLAVPGRAATKRGAGLKTVTVMMHHGTATAHNALVGLAIFDEDHVIDGLMHLFPLGELVAREDVGLDRPWPFRKLKWETSDGQEWSHPDLAQQHQRGLDREVTTGDEGSDD